MSDKSRSPALVQRGGPACSISLEACDIRWVFKRFGVGQPLRGSNTQQSAQHGSEQRVMAAPSPLQGKELNPLGFISQ